MSGARKGAFLGVKRVSGLSFKFQLHNRLFACVTLKIYFFFKYFFFILSLNVHAVSSISYGGIKQQTRFHILLISQMSIVSRGQLDILEAGLLLYSLIHCGVYCNVRVFEAYTVVYVKLYEEEIILRLKY